MRYRFGAVLLACVLACGFGTSALADPIEGLWQTTPGKEGGHLLVRIDPCGAAFCGVIVKAVNAAGEVSADYAHLGKRMVRDLAAEGGGAYSGGRIWAPDEDKTYRLKAGVTAAGLAISGCVLGFCRDAGVWTRVD